jgi:hypothetical protein
MKGFDFHDSGLPRINTACHDEVKRRRDEHGFFAAAKTGARLCPQDQSQRVDNGWCSEKSGTPCVADVLRLTLRAQPRSGKIQG